MRLISFRMLNTNNCFPLIANTISFSLFCLWFRCNIVEKVCLPSLLVAASSPIQILFSIVTSAHNAKVSLYTTTKSVRTQMRHVSTWQYISFIAFIALTLMESFVLSKRKDIFVAIQKLSFDMILSNGMRFHCIQMQPKILMKQMFLV